MPTTATPLSLATDLAQDEAARAVGEDAMPMAPAAIARQLSEQLRAVSAQTPTATPSRDIRGDSPGSSTPSSPFPLSQTLGNATSPALLDDGHTLPTARQMGTPAVALDALDELAYDLLPDEIQRAAEKMFMDSMPALAAEGAGPTLRRMLAREVELGRAEMRHVEALRNGALARYADGEGNEKRVLLYERVLSGQHRRWTTAVELLLRASAATGVVNVRAHNAAIMVGDRR